MMLTIHYINKRSVIKCRLLQLIVLLLPSMIKRRIKTYKQNNQRAFMAIKMAYKMRSDRFVPPVALL